MTATKTGEAVHEAIEDHLTRPSPMQPSCTIEIPRDVWKAVAKSGYFFDAHPRVTRVDARIRVDRASEAARHVGALVLDARGAERQRLRALARALEAVSERRGTA